MKKRLCVHFSLNHLTFNKVKSWWPRVSQLFFYVYINKFLWTYYVHKQSLSSLSISNTIPWKHQMPYMSIVNINTIKIRFNLENTTSHQRTFLTIKGHQTNNWRQIGKSMQDAFAKFKRMSASSIVCFVLHICVWKVDCILVNVEMWMSVALGWWLGNV